MARPDPSSSTDRSDVDLRADGILQITIRGVWNAAEVDAFFATLRPFYADARRRFRIARTLVLVEAVQSPAVAMQVRTQALAIKQPGDRRAFVVATFLSKIQIRRLATTDEFGLFTSRDAAEAWLLR